ncbi:MAG: class I SAM-dependent methyltransferase [Saprospiraceae bacterium]|nr:class I SAM-dependent methyltransferase [Saprospiraceae bacterium]
MQRLKRLVYKLIGKQEFKTLPHNDFLLRLRSSVIGEGMLHPGNPYLMDLAIRKMPVGGCVLEIGSYAGLSSIVLHYLLDQRQRKEPLYCCDAWIYEGYHDSEAPPSNYMDGRPDVLRTDFMAHIKASFIQSNQLFCSRQLPCAFHMESDLFFEKWLQNTQENDVFGRSHHLGGPISFAYIDGNHAYDYARRDVENTLKHLLPGGYMLLDDSAKHQQFGSARLAQELTRHPAIETIQANPNFLFRKKC